MSVKIRLALTGRSHQISYRMVAQDTHSKRDGKFLEILGFLNEFQKGNVSKFDKPRIDYYLSKGATFTPSAKFAFENGKLPPKVKKIKTPKTQDPQAPTPASAEVKSAPQTTVEQPIIEKPEAPAATSEETNTQKPQSDLGTTEKTSAAAQMKNSDKSAEPSDKQTD